MSLLRRAVSRPSLTVTNDDLLSYTQPDAASSRFAIVWTSNTDRRFVCESITPISRGGSMRPEDVAELCLAFEVHRRLM